ncbi:hypothetical protein [Bartonella acomydis]|uniref:hypothetical protein n=1 Tax=Bartonella acomydis TaxID=686234 RepID=UPI0031EFC84C
MIVQFYLFADLRFCEFWGESFEKGVGWRGNERGGLWDVAVLLCCANIKNRKNVASALLLLPHRMHELYALAKSAAWARFFVCAGGIWFWLSVLRVGHWVYWGQKYCGLFARFKVL